MDQNKQALTLHKKNKGKLTISPRINVVDRTDLALVYTPGVAAVSNLLAKQPELTNQYTWRGNLVAVISDGSAVLGLGNIGPQGAYPVMEGKSLLFKKFADIDSVPIVLNFQDTKRTIETILNIAPSFGAINLEDFAAPECFEIEEQLKAKLNIPVMHDDQWGTATIALAGLINSLKLSGKDKTKIKIIINGAGAAGSAVCKILLKFGCKNVILADSKGAIYQGRKVDHQYKKDLAKVTNPHLEKGDLKQLIKNADVFIGLSKANLLDAEHVKLMNSKPIIFALANPTPEIMPDIAIKAGAFIVATGRSDFPNQLNNALGFPGIFRGALNHGVKKITLDMLIKVAQNLAAAVKNPTTKKIIPSIFDKHVVNLVAKAIK